MEIIMEVEIYKDVTLSLISNSCMVSNITCSELYYDSTKVSCKLINFNKKNLHLDGVYKLEFTYGDLITTCENARMSAYQLCIDDEDVCFIKFRFDSSKVRKNKFKILYDTVKSLFNDIDNKFIVLNLGRHAGHTTTLLKLLDETPNSVLIVNQRELKYNYLRRCSQLNLPNVTDRNVVAINSVKDVQTKFLGQKYDVVFIDNYSYLSKDVLHSLPSPEYNNIRYVCLG